MQISLVIPLLNEAESLPELHAWITDVMRQNNFSYKEFVNRKYFYVCGVGLAIKKS